jgi:hypothetical protein
MLTQRAAALLPRWKSAYAQVMTALSGKSHVVSSDLQNNCEEGQYGNLYDFFPFHPEGYRGNQG